MSQNVERVALKHSFYWLSSVRPCSKRFSPKTTLGSSRSNSTDEAIASYRRRSLTLATNLGQPYVNHYYTKTAEKTCKRKVHISTKKETTALEFASHMKYEIGKENLTTVSSAQFESTASQCPFHSLFTSKNDKVTSQKLNGYSQARELSVASNLGDLSETGKMSNTFGKMIKDLNVIRRKVMTDVTRIYGHIFQDERAANTSTKYYSEIPGPRSLPFLGSVLDYTFLGPFTPRKFHEAIFARHEK